jgi:hypothetical protein
MMTLGIGYAHFDTYSPIMDTFPYDNFWGIDGSIRHDNGSALLTLLNTTTSISIPPYLASVMAT